MMRSAFKKEVRTTFHGNAYPWGQWTERVRTVKQGNRAFRRKGKKIS